MAIRAGFFVLALAGLVNAGTPPLPNINTNLVFDVTNTTFAGGALGNGVSNSTAAIQAAINTASTASASGATVRVLAVGTLTNYLCGPISLANNVNLLIDTGAKLQMFPLSVWSNSYGVGTTFINGSGRHDVEISGSGTIDGNAGFNSGSTTNWWGPFPGNTPADTRPNFINLSSCTRVLIQDVTLQNPPTFHLMLKGNNVSMTIQNITINTDPNSPNTDGMDLGSTNVLIQNCSISCGDDNIEIGGSSAGALDITVSNCTFGTGHGVSLGSLVNGGGKGVQDLIVSNCTFNGTDYGIRMKSDRDRGGICQNLRYMDITMTNVDYPIVIYSYYNSVGTPNSITPFRASTDTVHTVTGTTPIWRNITVSNVTATALTGSSIGGIIWGVPEMLVSNVTLCKVNFAAPTKTFNIYNAQAIKIVDSSLTAPTTTTNTLNLYNAAITVSNTLTITNITLGGLAKPPTNNTLAFLNSRATITDSNLLGTGSITLSGSTLTFSQTSVNSSNSSISVIGASTLFFARGSNTLNGALSGSAALTVPLTNSNIMLSLQGDATGFTGTLTFTNTGTLRFNQGTNVWGVANATLDAGASATIKNRSTSSAVTIFLGALTGGSASRLQGSDQSGSGLDAYVVGGLNSNTSFAGTIADGGSHSVALTKIGNGMLTLTSTNAYGGGTTVSNGTLLVNNTAGSGTSTGAVAVVSGATLSGSGVIAGPVTVSGTLAPGNGVGTLTISNNLAINASAVLQYSLGTNSDKTTVSSNLTLGGTVDFTDAGGVTNTTYTLFTYGGTLASNALAIGVIPNTNFTYAIDTNTIGQVNVVVTVPTPFPQWQLQFFGCTNCPQAVDSADPDGDSQSNLTEFLAGTDPTNSLASWRIQASPTNGLPPMAVSFSENSTGSSITNRLWDFGDGATGSGSNPSHTYINAGTFSVSLTILNYYGPATLVASNLITVSSIATWTNANASGNWSTTTSWDPLSTPDFGADVIFANGGETAVVDNVSRTVGDIAFDWSGNFTVAASGGASLAINDGITVMSNFTYTISAPVLLVGSNTWSVTSGGTLQMNGPVSGTNTIAKTGDGTLILSGTNTYSGKTMVSNGTLKVTGAGLITNTPSIEVVDGATLDVSAHTGGSMTLVNGQTLMGRGAIQGTLILAGGSTLSPGSSVGTLTFLNDLVVSNASVLQYDLGTNSDLAVVSSNLTLGGTLNISDAGGFITGAYTLFNYGGMLTYTDVTISTTPNPNYLYAIDTNAAGQVRLNVLAWGAITMTAANLQDASGNLMPTNGVAVLVADTTNTGFVDPQSTDLLALGASWGSANKLVWLWDLRDSFECAGQPGALCTNAVVIYTNGIAPGQKLQLYWFPALTLASNVVGITQYGKYTDQVGIDGSDVWDTPANATSVNLLFITADQSGSNPEAAGRATPVTTLPLTAFQNWQISYFGSTNNPSGAPDVDADGDGLSNTNEFLAGTNPTNSASALQVISTIQQGTNIVITWTTAGGFTNVVQVTPGIGAGNYYTNFADLSAPIIISGIGDVTTNYVDGGGATNVPARYYRVRLVP